MTLAELRAAAAASYHQTGKTYGPDKLLVEQLCAAERAERARIHEALAL